MSLRIACAQLNLGVGDMAGNVRQIVAAAGQAQAQGADILLTPALSLCGGYGAADNFFRQAFQQQVDQALEQIREASASLPSLHWVVGYPVQHEGRRYAAAGVFCQGRLLAEYRQAELADTGVFAGSRYFSAAAEPAVLVVKDIRCGLLLGEDGEQPAAPLRARAAGAELLLWLSASAYRQGIQAQRRQLCQQHICSEGMAVVCCNLVGGQDALLFDGSSHALDASGALAAQARAFEQDLLLIEIRREAGGRLQLSGRQQPAAEPLAELYQALVLGIHDYVGRNGFAGVIIGLSGGIDSAMVAALAVDALGADRVRTAMMASPYTADISVADAADMAERLGVHHDSWPIAPCFDAFRDTLAGTFAGLPEDITEENIQARIRGTLLMALSNKTGWLVLTTSNKSEVAVGYSTLYGDMVGGYAPLKDVLKTDVYRLAHYRNSLSEVIPPRIITRPPSAELRPGQTDQDSLPAYAVLDRIIVGYVEQDLPAAELVRQGLPADAVAQVLRLLRTSEYKRQQGAVGPQVSARAFGRDWRYPLTSAFRES